jgi:hypothetical protein
MRPPCTLARCPPRSPLLALLNCSLLTQPGGLLPLACPLPRVSRAACAGPPVPVASPLTPPVSLPVRWAAPLALVLSLRLGPGFSILGCGSCPRMLQCACPFYPSSVLVLAAHVSVHPPRLGCLETARPLPLVVPPPLCRPSGLLTPSSAPCQPCPAWLRADPLRSVPPIS